MPTSWGHEGYPITVKAEYKEFGRGGSTKRMIFVMGHAHYPDGTRMAVGLRYEGQDQYVVWYNATVIKQSFVAELGPWMKDLSPGQYIVEAWFNFDRQSKQIQQKVVETDAAVEGGGVSSENAKCKPEVLAAKKDCLSKNVVGACVVMVGTPNQYQMDEQRNGDFLVEALGVVESLRAELKTVAAKHQEALKKPAGSPKPGEAAPPAALDQKAWEAWTGDWMTRLDEVDQKLSEWKMSRVVQKDSDVYADMVNALIKLRDLCGLWGTKLYKLEAGVMGVAGGTVNADAARPEQADKEIGELIDGTANDPARPGLKKKLARTPAEEEGEGKPKAGGGK
ncbi:MAG: hypothetical protein HYZ53_24965 [Planctomycetes bacterium]|nr:hypothetical protein [Planctomycetota bacterium]